MMPRAILSQLTQIPWLNLERSPRVQDFEGRVLLLDFWTFCCVNCLHVLPELHRLEQEFGDRLTVLGIHSAKFEHEKDSAQIVQAIEKYGIRHPVANDADFLLWKSLGVNAWPSFALISSEGRLVELTSGEGVYAKLRDRIAIEVAKLAGKPTPFPAVTLARSESELRYPGKILWDEPSRRLIVADSEHHRIRVFNEHGGELDAFGSGLMGLKDGPADEAQFHSPQGLALRGNALFVADTENHAIRRIDLSARQVTTLFGNGQQSRVAYWRETLGAELNSPWDLAFQGDDLIIAMAGTHQLYRMTSANILEKFVGSGVENLVDGNAQRACLAQTSGLAVHADGTLYFVDPETSALRQFRDGQVSTLVGTGLFDFGFRDGHGAPEDSGALLQHPLGLAVSQDKIYVADTYNHAIRVFDLNTQTLTTLGGGRGYQDGPLGSARFLEPSALALVGTKLFVADTNNHALRVIDLEQKSVSTWALQALPKKSAENFLPNLVLDKDLAAAPLPFRLSWTLPAGFKLNALAPSQLHLRSATGTERRWNLQAHVGTELDIASEDFARGATLELTLYPCPADGHGECHIVSARLRLAPGGTESGFRWEVPAI